LTANSDQIIKSPLFRRRAFFFFIELVIMYSGIFEAFLPVLKDFLARGRIMAEACLKLFSGRIQIG